MDFLNCQFIGNGPNVQKCRRDVEGMKLRIICNSEAWNTQKRVSTFAIGLLGVLLASVGWILYATGSINFNTALAFTGFSGAILFLDLLAIAYFFNKHRPFLNAVEKGCGSINVSLMAISAPAKHASAHPENSPKLIVSHRFRNQFFFEFYETDEMFQNAVNYYKNRNRLNANNYFRQ